MSSATAKLRLVSEKAERALPIQTVYTFEQKVTKKNRAGKPLRAAELSLRHLRRNDYKADTAEVYNLVTGKLYSVMRRTVTGELLTVFQTPLRKDE